MYSTCKKAKSNVFRGTRVKIPKYSVLRKIIQINMLPVKIQYNRSGVIGNVDQWSLNNLVSIYSPIKEKNLKQYLLFNHVILGSLLPVIKTYYLAFVAYKELRIRTKNAALNLRIPYSQDLQLHVAVIEEYSSHKISF
ncbi:hypothetical protein EGR_00691 [Echinococcus granulosus]|uniref:Uncharacterized protein n=1 Tax=Echinococcus granulosus TaxID=6210 RepID=W6UZZ6_ECHGR|nr:hypothetical protein EGR_00691 [Echinococcus granulosus]EUB64147.1 hypothetical protein EGR_00691 [Echinococcus granulosus]